MNSFQPIHDNNKLKRPQEFDIHFFSPIRNKKQKSQEDCIEKVQNLFSTTNPLSHETMENGEVTLKLFECHNLENELKEPLKAIQQWVQKKNYLYGKMLEISNRCSAILKNEEWSVRRKLAELGILYYYLSSNKVLPKNNNLLQSRLNEIKEWVGKVQNAHRKNLGNKSSSHLSEEILYVKRTLMHMIFANEGGFNRGGLIAARTLLDADMHTIVGSEMRNQMVSILDRLESDETFRSYFETPFEVNPKAQDLVRCDLMLSPDTPIHFIHVRWALLSALFSVQEQKWGEENCYAIALTLILQQKNPDVCIQYLIEALKTGYISIEGGKIDISLLLKSDLLRKDEALETLTKSQSFSLLEPLIEYCPVAETFNKESVVQEGNSENCLKEIFGIYAPYAQALYLTQGRSLLHLLLLRYVQFFCSNSTRVASSLLKTNRRPSIKLEFIYHILGYLKRHTSSEQQSFTSIIADLLWPFEKAFYFVDQGNDVYIKEGRVHFSHSTSTLKFTGNPDDYHAFQYLRRLYFYDGKKYHPVDSIRALPKYIQHIVEETFLSLADPSLKGCKEFLLEKIDEEGFKTLLAQFIGQKNKKQTPLSAQAYLDSDAFCIAQGGGNLFAPLNSIDLYPLFKVRTNEMLAQDVGSWFQNLQESIQFYSKEMAELGLENNRVLTLSQGHAFRIYPSNFQEFSNIQDPLLHKILDPAKQLLKKQLSRDEMLCILCSSRLLHEFKEDEVEELLRCKSVENFIELALENVKVAEHAQNFHRACEEILLQIPKESFQKAISPILKTFKLSQSEKEIFLQSVESAIGRTQSLLPYDLAQIIQLALNQLETPQWHCVFSIENKIRQACHLPCELIFGDLNWSEGSVRKEFYYGVLGFDFFKKTLRICLKNQGVNYFSDLFDKHLKKIRLIF